MYDPVIQQIRELGEQGILLSGDPGEGPLLGNVRPVPQPPGRGVLIRRREDPVVVQLAVAEPGDISTPSSRALHADEDRDRHADLS